MERGRICCLQSTHVWGIVCGCWGSATKVSTAYENTSSILARNLRMVLPRCKLLALACPCHEE
eukprot:6176006-Pleurochrysis_carterae.AAC.3